MRIRERFSKIKTSIGKYMRKSALVMYILFFISLIIHFICRFSKTFSDFMNMHVAKYVRLVLAKITGILPFSIAEFIILGLPLIMIAIIARVIILTRRNEQAKVYRFFVSAFACVSLFFVLYVFTYGMGYSGSTIGEKMSMNVEDSVSEENLKTLAKTLAKQVNESAKQIKFKEKGSSYMEYDFSELNAKLNNTWKKVSKDYAFIEGHSTSCKPVLSSKLMSYTGTLGLYSYFTGEANINVHFPDYTIPYTMAHEMAHQRGIAREDEANFVAYLICTESDDPYIRYSGELSLLEYVLIQLKKYDKKATDSVIRSLCDEVKYELNAYVEFSTTYSQGKVSKVNNKINDTYLKIQGQKEGAKTYNLVVRLAAAYILGEN